MSRYEAIVIGGGHNALVACALLAQAGQRVLLLEATEQLGGTAGTDEFAPGFHAPAVFASADRLSPEIVQQLGLARHGLKLVAGTGTAMLRPGQQPVWFGASGSDGASGPHPEAAISEADRQQLQRLQALLGRITGALGEALSGRLPALPPSGLGNVLELLFTALRFRRLGRVDMVEAMRLLPMSLRDVTEERFDSEVVRAAVSFPGLACSWLGPISPGGGLSLLLHLPRGRLLGPPVLAAGGPDCLVQALAAAARAGGAELRTGARVTQIRVHEDRVAGVTLQDGSELDAPVVVSGLDPHTTMLGLLQRGSLEPEQATTYGNIRARGTVSIVRLALDGLPQIEPEAARGWLRLGPSLRAQEQAFDPVKYGELPEAPMIEALIPSLADPSLAPEGRHVLHARVQYTPYTLRQASWPQRREQLLRRTIDSLDACLPGLARGVLHADLLTPADIEQRWGLTGGHPYHAELALDQALVLRPVAGWYDYATPMDGLYLCGPGTHPGGGLTGLPGRNAAQRVLEDARRS